MLPHIGDVDVVFHCSNELAIPRGHLPKTQLSAEFHNYVWVYEIVDVVPDITDRHFPGHVYLASRYLLTECSDDGKYDCNDDDERYYLSNRTFGGEEYIHGPALHTDNSRTSLLPVDLVRCVRCLVWPSQSAKWPTRHRNYGWPNSATLDRVVNNGCDVVGVAHRQCRQHEWMGELQWRLSFSRAEIVLINVQLDAITTGYLSYVAIFHKNRAITRLC